MSELFDHAIGAYEAAKEAAERVKASSKEQAIKDIRQAWVEAFGCEPDSVMVNSVGWGNNKPGRIFHDDRTFLYDMSYDYYVSLNGKTYSVGGLQGGYFRLLDSESGRWSRPICDLETLGEQLVEFAFDEEDIPF